MIITMHGLSTMHGNMLTDIRLAQETGYDALEIVESKLLRYLDCGFTAKDLVPLFDKAGIRAVCINALKDVDRVRPKERKQLLLMADRLCAAAATLGCPTLQLVPFCALKGRPWKEVLRLTARNVRDIADIANGYGVRCQLEPIAWAPIHSLSQSLELIDAAGRENVGLVIDFWHLWAGEATTPDEVAALDPAQIIGVHFCDGIKHPKGKKWIEAELRAFLPGEGKLPIREWVSAVRATGFDGVWSPELYSPKHWEWDLLAIAREAKSRMEQYLKS